MCFFVLGTKYFFFMKRDTGCSPYNSGNYRVTIPNIIVNTGIYLHMYCTVIMNDKISAFI
jgi:hypothetical protein